MHTPISLASFSKIPLWYVMADARKRKEKFSSHELEALVDEVHQRKSILFGEFSSTLTASTKHCAWAAITDRINSIAKSPRTIEDVKKKWSNLASNVKLKEAKRRKLSGGTDGGSPPEDELTPEEAQVLTVIGIESVIGVQGGGDTDEPESVDLPLPGPNEPNIEISRSSPSVNEPSTSCAHATPRYALYIYSIIGLTQAWGSERF